MWNNTLLNPSLLIIIHRWRANANVSTRPSNLNVGKELSAVKPSSDDASSNCLRYRLAVYYIGSSSSSSSTISRANNISPLQRL